VYGFADEETGLGKPKLYRGSGAYGPLWIMWGQGNAIRVGEGGDPPGTGETSAVSKIKLADVASPALEQFPKCLDVRQSFASGDGRRHRRVDGRQPVDGLWPTGLFQEQ
jgi:hypothetical protein